MQFDKKLFQINKWRTSVKRLINVTTGTYVLDYETYVYNKRNTNRMFHLNLKKYIEMKGKKSYTYANISLRLITIITTHKEVLIT